MEKIIKKIAEELNVKNTQVENAVKLIVEVIKKLDRQTVDNIILG